MPEELIAIGIAIAVLVCLYIGFRWLLWIAGGGSGRGNSVAVYEPDRSGGSGGGGGFGKMILIGVVILAVVGSLNFLVHPAYVESTINSFWISVQGIVTVIVIGAVVALAVAGFISIARR